MTNEIYRWCEPLAETASSFFQMELRGVTIQTGAAARELGAAAFTLGDRVHFASGLAMSAFEFLELLGHELAHVVQQRQGRVRGDFAFRGFSLNADPELEREAWETGRLFAQGAPLAPPRCRGVGNAPAKPSAVVQRAVTVAGRPVRARADLAPPAGAVLGLIGGGEEWLDWAIGNFRLNYHFADERKLVTGVQSGLHGGELMLLRGVGLMISPVRLLGLQTDELKLLAAADSETGDSNSVTQMQARKMLARQRLRTESDLAIGTDLLAEAGVAKAPLFQAMSLNDRIALFDLVDGASGEHGLNPMIQKEAAEFAVQHADNPREFADYYQFYITIVSGEAPLAKNAKARQRKAEAGLDALTEVLRDTLFCPSVQGEPSREQLQSIVQNWTATGNHLGFARLSLAVAEVAQHAELKGETGEAAARLIDRHLTQAEQHILRRPAQAARLSQSGEETIYDFPGKRAWARVNLAANGCVTLSSYQAKPSKVEERNNDDD